MRNRSTWISLAIVALLVAAHTLYRHPPSLQPTLVDDPLHLFSAEQLARISGHHAFLLQDHGIDYRVVTRSLDGDINRFAVEYFAAEQVGSASPRGLGLLLVIDPAQDRVRMEVGQGLEGVFVDAFVAYVEQRQMVPFFARDRVADGVLATTEMIVTRVQNAKRNGGFEGESWAATSAGAGATARAQIGAGEDNAFRRGQDVAAATSPAATLERYREAMAQRNLRTDLEIYSADTRKMLANWVMTAAQADNQARSLAQCQPLDTRLSDDGQRAVIRYPIKARQCNPWFFLEEDGAWRLDLTLMQQAIRFGRSNAWRFDKGVEHPYRFAFDDWELDENGFPLRVRSP